MEEISDNRFIRRKVNTPGNEVTVIIPTSPKKWDNNLSPATNLVHYRRQELLKSLMKPVEEKDDGMVQCE
jgi:hypothetical protein